MLISMSGIPSLAVSWSFARALRRGLSNTRELHTIGGSILGSVYCPSSKCVRYQVQVLVSATNVVGGDNRVKCSPKGIVVRGLNGACGNEVYHLHSRFYERTHTIPSSVSVRLGACGGTSSGNDPSVPGSHMRGERLSVA